MAHILLVEDDLMFIQLITHFLIKNGYTLDVKSSVREGVRAIEQEPYDFVLLDYNLPDGNGLEVLAAVRERNLQCPVIIMTSFNDLKTAVKAIRLGAQDYITKPVNPDQLLMIIAEGLLKKETPVRTSVKETNTFVKGNSGLSQQLNEFINLIAPTEISVIIQGESGTGKEHVARTIHHLSKRSKAPFIAIDCGALSNELASSELFGHVKGAFTGALQDKKGQFEAANGGTLFLDEVGNLSYGIQVKLLRAIQERVIQPLGSVKQQKVDVRIITATNDDLQASVKNGTFREDLYHRLNEFKIKVPALRNREADLETFINHFIAIANRELNKNITEIAPDVVAVFKKYDWPGNLRELRNVMKRAVLLTKNGAITKQVLPLEMVETLTQQPRRPDSDLKAMNELNERELIIKVLQEVKYNKSKAAIKLNIDRKTLYLKLAKYNIEHN
ncbi:MAG: sigma-54-dependent Fis family transcriptional regulator [Bacteroidetes bacterium]|nr:sigma-54-dependent Fis family transcriptional regulator [Bacteroidota bacterium]